MGVGALLLPATVPVALHVGVVGQFRVAASVSFSVVEPARGVFICSRMGLPARLGLKGMEVEPEEFGLDEVGVVG